MAAMAVGGAALGAYGQYQQGKAQSAAYKQQAENEKYQAMLNDSRAGIEQIKGQEEAQRRAEQVIRDIGSNKTAFAGNGLLLENGGTVEAVQDATRMEGARDIQTIRDNTALSVWGFQTNAAIQRQNAKNLRASATAARRGANLAAFGSLLGGAGGAGMAAYGAYGGGSGAGGAGGGGVTPNTSGVRNDFFNKPY